MKIKSDSIVATLVIACSLVLLAALVFSIGGNPLRRPVLRLTIDFPDVTGIGKNSDVLFGGDRIGVVDRIEILAPGERLSPDRIARAHVAILKEVPIPAHVDALIASESMLGEKHIALRRIDDGGGLLADGAKLSSASTGSMLEMVAPGVGDVVGNLKAITASLKAFSGRLGEGENGEAISGSLTNVRDLTASLKSALAGDGGSPGITENFKTLASTLNTAAGGIRDLVSGPAGREDEGLATKGRTMAANLDSFSTELNRTLAGTPGGEPGLRKRLDSISAEVERMLAGGGSEAGLRRQLDVTMQKVDMLVEEMNALVVWGEYITGTLAGKPNRIIFGNKENEIPTKEQVIRHLRETGEPYPVRIRGAKTDGDPAAGKPKPTPAP